VAANLVNPFLTTNTSNNTTITVQFGFAADANDWWAQNLQVAFGQEINALQIALDQLLSYQPPEALVRARRLMEGVLPAEEVLRWDHDGYVQVPSRMVPGLTYRIYDQSVPPGLPAEGEHFPRTERGEPGIYAFQGDTEVAFVCIHAGDLHKIQMDALVAKYLVCRYAENELYTIGNWRRQQMVTGRFLPMEPPAALPAEIVVEVG